MLSPFFAALYLFRSFSVWFQLMSRIQDRLALVYAPLESFQTADGSRRHGIEAESMEDLTATSTEQKPSAHGAPVTVLYEEHTPDSWINVSAFGACESLKGWRKGIIE